MKRRPRSALVAVAALLLGVGAGASERSERLYSRGLVEFHAGRYRTALTWFEEAVEASPDDPYAHYYAGVTRGRLGNFEGAIAALRAALDKRPGFTEAALELGVAMVEAGRYAEAAPWLEQAQRAATLEPHASLFLGIAQLRLQQLDRAARSFRRASAGEAALRVPARYYLGVAAHQAGRRAEAEEHFLAVADATPASEMGREAARFLAALGARQRGAYEVFGRLAFEYDSNLAMAPSDDGSGDDIVSEEGDGRIAVTVGGAYVAWRNAHALLSVRYELFQSFHFDSTEFNLHSHRPSLELTGGTGAVRFGLLGRYDYHRLKDADFLQEGMALPWLTITDARFGRTELSYRMRRRDFLDSSFCERDSFNHAARFRQVFEIDGPRRYVAVGYGFDREDPVRSSDGARMFAYGGHELRAGVGWELPAAVTARASYAYRHEIYDPESRLAREGARRRDDEHRVIVLAQKDLTEHLRVTGAYFGTINDSNQVFFEYERHIGSVELEVRF